MAAFAKMARGNAALPRVLIAATAIAPAAAAKQAARIARQCTATSKISNILRNEKQSPFG
jgi:hypothetical protein